MEDFKTESIFLLAGYILPPFAEYAYIMYSNLSNPVKLGQSTYDGNILTCIVVNGDPVTYEKIRDEPAKGRFLFRRKISLEEFKL